MTMFGALLAAIALQAAPPPALTEELRPLAPLLGHCWRATFPSSQITDTHCWSVMPGGRQVRDRHVVRGAPGPYSGESLYRWDPEARRIRYDSYASDGGYSTGFVEVTADGLSFPDETHVALSSERTIMRNSMTWESPTRFIGASSLRRREAWHEMWRMPFERVSAAPAEPTP